VIGGSWIVERQLIEVRWSGGMVVKKLPKGHWRRRVESVGQSLSLSLSSSLSLREEFGEAQFL